MIRPHRKTRSIRTDSIIKTKRDLIRLKRLCLPTLRFMGISRRIRQFPIRFGKEKEFQPNSSAFYTKKDIVIKRGTGFLEAFRNLTHEYGHEVTITGGWGNKSNLITETTAFNFQKIYIANFNKIHNADLRLVHSMSFSEDININSTHALAIRLSFIPLGYLIKTKYSIRN